MVKAEPGLHLPGDGVKKNVSMKKVKTSNVVLW